MTKTLDDKEQFILLRAKIYSFDRIAEEINASKPTLLNWQGEFSEKIKEAQYFETENIVNEFKIMRRNRTEVISQVLRATLEELGSRVKNKELKSLPTDKLFNLMLSLEKRLEKDTKRKLLRVPSDRELKILRELNEIYIEVE